MYRKRLDFYDSCCYFQKLKITQLLTLTHYYYNMKGTSSYQHWQPNYSQHNFGDLNSYDFYFLFFVVVGKVYARFLRCLGAIYVSQLCSDTAALKLLVFGNIILCVSLVNATMCLYLFGEPNVQNLFLPKFCPKLKYPF